MDSNVSFLRERFLQPTSFLGIRLWILIAASVVSLLVVIMLIVSLYCLFCRRKKNFRPTFRLPIKSISPKLYQNSYRCTSSLDRRLLTQNVPEVELNMSGRSAHHLTISDRWSARFSCSYANGSRFSATDIEEITNNFANENVIERGDYGVVYSGVLLETVRVAVKRLFDNSYEAEDLAAQVEAIANVRHKNLVKLIGYCVEGAYRSLVYEHIDNGSLFQWIHGSVGQERPLTWQKRMKIIHGIAKGLTYLHEDIEPKIVHENLKSSNILLDFQWNPKIADVGLSKLFGSELGTGMSPISGYLSAESSSPDILRETSDVYRFGILIMEIVTGRSPVVHGQPQVYIVDWLKSMVANHKIVHVLDPKLPEHPSLKELKRIILISLRCVDPDVNHRPKMGNIVHMLEPRDLLLNDAHPKSREFSRHKISEESHKVYSENMYDSSATSHEGNYNQYQKMVVR